MASEAGEVMIEKASEYLFPIIDASIKKLGEKARDLFFEEGK